jgi:hypothetical protein
MSSDLSFFHTCHSMTRVTNVPSRSDNCINYQGSGIEIQKQIRFQNKEFYLYTRKKGFLISCKTKGKSATDNFIYCKSVNISRNITIKLPYMNRKTTFRFSELHTLMVTFKLILLMLSYCLLCSMQEP